MENKLIKLLECKQEVVGELYNELAELQNEYDFTYDLFMDFIGDNIESEDKFVTYLHNKLIKANNENDNITFDYVISRFSDYIDFKYLDSIGVIQIIH